jgi:hypothetical protein
MTRHAAERWKQRTRLKTADDLLERWNDETASAVEIKLDGVGRTLALLGHEFKDARYFRSKSGWIFVVEGDTIVTVHEGSAKRFKNAR